MQYTEGVLDVAAKEIIKNPFAFKHLELISLELETMDCGHTLPSPGRALGVAMNVTSLNNPARQHVSYCPL